MPIRSKFRLVCVLRAWARVAACRVGAWQVRIRTLFGSFQRVIQNPHRRPVRIRRFIAQSSSDPKIRPSDPKVGGPAPCSKLASDDCFGTKARTSRGAKIGGPSPNRVDEWASPRRGSENKALRRRTGRSEPLETRGPDRVCVEAGADAAERRSLRSVPPDSPAGLRRDRKRNPMSKICVKLLRSSPGSADRAFDFRAQCVFAGARAAPCARDSF